MLHDCPLVCGSLIAADSRANHPPASSGQIVKLQHIVNYISEQRTKNKQRNKPVSKKVLHIILAPDNRNQTASSLLGPPGRHGHISQLLAVPYLVIRGFGPHWC